MSGNKEKCIIVKILDSKPENKSFTPGSIKFIPIGKLDTRFKVIIIIVKYST